MTATSAACLHTRALHHAYPNGDAVLADVGLHVPYGSIYGFLGPNGAGKTTTLRLILGLLRRQRGDIELFGQSLDAHRLEILRRVGALIETPSVYEHLTAVENLEVLRTIHRVAPARIAQVLALVGLAATGRKRAGQFSLGMKQRLGIAAALLHRPQLLILDEPTNGLDPNGIVEIRELLVRLNREHGITIVISSHLLGEMEKLVTHAGVIRAGRLIFQGTLDKLRSTRRRRAPVVLATGDNRRALEVLAHLGARAELVQDRILLPAMDNETIALTNRCLVEAGVAVHQIGAPGHDLESLFMDMLGDAQ